MKRIAIIIVLISMGGFLHGQNENRHFLFGRGISYAEEMVFYHVVFNDTGIARQQLNYNHPRYISFRGNTASYADPETGDLLTYTDGHFIYNNNFDIMDGGDSLYLNKSSRRDVPYAHNSNTGYSYSSGMWGPFGSVYIPLPDNPRYIYMFNSCFIDGRYNYDTTFYNVIDMEANGGLGKVIEHNQPYVHQDRKHFPLFIRHANGRDWWIFVFSQRKTVVLLFDPTGIHFFREIRPPSILDLPALNAGLRMMNSPYFHKGRGQILHHQFSGEPSEGHYLFSVLFYDVDRCNGTFELAKEYTYSVDQLPMFDEKNKDRYYTFNLSADGRYLYMMSSFSVDQYDLSVEGEAWKDTQVRLVNALDSTFPTNDRITGGEYGFFSSFVGMDDRIYMATVGQLKVGVIKNPHRGGMKAGATIDGIVIPEANDIASGMNYFLSTPMYLDYELGPVDGSVCDTLGLDNEVVALFRKDHYGAADLEVEFVDLSKKFPTMWSWDFGDGTTSSERFPVHVYAESGTYRVCLTVSNEVSEDTYCEEVIIEDVTSIASLSEQGFQIFPNPVDEEEIYVSQSSEVRKGNIVLYDMHGREVREYKLEGSSSQRLDITGVRAGVYILEIKTQEGEVGQEKLIVQ